MPPLMLDGQATVLPRLIVAPYSKVTVVGEPLGLISVKNLNVLLLRESL